MSTSYIQKVIDVENKAVDKLEKSKSDLDKDFLKHSEELKKSHSVKVADLDAASKKEIEKSSNQVNKEIAELKEKNDSSVKDIEKKFKGSNEELVSKCVEIILS